MLSLIDLGLQLTRVMLVQDVSVVKVTGGPGRCER